VCFTQRAREGKFHFYHHHWQEAHIEDRGSTQDTEVNLEEQIGPGGDPDSGVTSTLGRHGSNVHMTRVHLKYTTARSTPTGYGDQADLTATEDQAAGHHVMSTVSLNRDKDLDSEDSRSQGRCC